MWFSDPGSTKAVGVIDPFTQAISEFSEGLNAGSNPLGIASVLLQESGRFSGSGCLGV
jgi:hypothetical protein